MYIMYAMDEFINDLQSDRRLLGDPFFADGNAVYVLGSIEPVFDVDDEELCHKIVPAFSCDVAGCSQTFTSLYEYEQHYNSAHRYVCKECRKTLPSAHLLDLHIMETHDSYFSVLSERKAMYQCFVEDCAVKFPTPEERRSHCIDFHKFPSDFRFDRARKSKRAPVRSKRGEKGGNGMALAITESEEESIMDDSSTLPPANSKISCVPKRFTFGYHQERTFVASKAKGGKSKHWYQQKKPVNSDEKGVTAKEIPSMGELMDSLPSANTWY